MTTAIEFKSDEDTPDIFTSIDRKTMWNNSSILLLVCLSFIAGRRKPGQLLFSFSVRQHKPLSCTSIPSLLLYLSFILPPSLSGISRLFLLITAFLLHPHSFPQLSLHPSSAAAAAAAGAATSPSPSSSQRRPPSAFLSRALQRLYGPLSYQLHCGISRLSGMSSGELSVPPPPPPPLLTAGRTTFVDLVFFFLFLFAFNRIKMKERTNAT